MKLGTLALTSAIVLGSIFYIDTNDEVKISSFVFALPEIRNESITVGWVGDMVPSEDVDYNYSVFSNTASLLSEPDLMIGNLEGTFASEERVSKCEVLKSMCYAFRGHPSFANAISNAGFDIVSLVNNHSYDFGEDGLGDTEVVLNNANIPYITTKNPSTSLRVQGKDIGILGLSSTKPSSTITDYEFIESEVSKLNETNDFVIVIFHGGAEGEDKSTVPGENEYMGSEDRGNVELVAKTAIDAGADLVLGAGPHVLRKIETYQNVPIAYSLGNFVGSKKLITIGDLKYSGILTATLEKNKKTAFDFISILLTPDGIPSFDPTNESRFFLQNLN